MSRVESSQGGPKFWLAWECAALFLGVPAVVAARWVRFPAIGVLLVMMAGCWVALEWRQRVRLRSLWRPRVSRREWVRVLLLYVAALPVLLIPLWLVDAKVRFFLPRQHPGFWLLLLAAYPIFSVFPQEVIYRAFFFERYRPLFGRGAGMIAASAAAFSFCHIVFHNWIAVALTLVGGCFFGLTYRRTASLMLTCAEHTLYGWAIFTIGYGQFFFERLPWLSR
jgi:membrane protease YdiL (CAAX protease family)